MDKIGSKTKMILFRQQEGWLATGNINCMIGCTSTSIAFVPPHAQCSSKACHQHRGATSSPRDCCDCRQSNEIRDFNRSVPSSSVDRSQRMTLPSGPSSASTGTASLAENNSNGSNPSASSSQRAWSSQLNRTNFNQRGHKSDVS